MRRVILLRYGEIHLKGNNRGYFERLLVENIKKAISQNECKFTKIGGRYVVSDYNISEEKILVEKIKKVFGLVSLSVAYETQTTKENITNLAIKYFGEVMSDNIKTFRVTTKRADKTFDVNSDVFSGEVGGLILAKYNNLKVKLKEPDFNLFIDIRENGKTYIYGEKIPCLGGMPVGSAGSGLLMLSGGIDSPVAGYEMAKRGMRVNAIHFHSYPYTSLQAKNKVIELAKILSGYAGKIKLYCVSFTKIQEAIHANCDDAYMINIMRRIMLRIAEKICINNGYQAIITGESLGQVASQTIESITSTNSVVKKLPILRPLISNDKEETIKIAKEINTFNTSILPYEDCCTVFLPKNPIIKPIIKKVEAQERYLDIDILIDEALETIEIINI